MNLLFFTFILDDLTKLRRTMTTEGKRVLRILLKQNDVSEHQ